jgi:hypothetical protein
MVAGRRRHHAVSVWVQGEARQWAGARERDAVLRALGASIASDRRDRGDAHDEARAGLARGIGHWGQGRAGGEVTAQTAVGGALPTLGYPQRAC